MKLLFISRAYPPVVGGIENHNFELSKRFPKETTDFLINTRGKKFLPIFLPYALVKVLLTSRKYDAILLGDGVLSILGFFAKQVSKKTLVASVVHGLDITYKNPVYQMLWVRMFLPCLDKLIAVSTETKNTAIQYGLSEKKVAVVPNGVELSYTPEKYNREKLSEILGIDTTKKIILLTHGRLAKRKGVDWFLKNVLPTLPSEFHYVISGDGPEKETIQETIKIHGLENRTSLLGRVSDETKDALLHTIDLFIQPNITVSGDMEGFGIAVIEATSLARVVLASNIEGLKDAIAGGENGYPLPSGDTEAWREAVILYGNDRELREKTGKQYRAYTLEHFSWERITKEYLRLLTRG